MLADISLLSSNLAHVLMEFNGICGLIFLFCFQKMYNMIDETKNDGQLHWFLVIVFAIDSQ